MTARDDVLGAGPIGVAAETDRGPPPSSRPLSRPCRWRWTTSSGSSSSASRTTAPSWSGAAPDEVADRVREGLADAYAWPSGRLPDAWLPAGVDRVGDEPPLTPTPRRARRRRHHRRARDSRDRPIVLDHGAGQGRRALSLVPDRHVRVVSADQVVTDVPDAVRGLVGASAHVDQRSQRHQRHRARPRGGRPRPENLHVIVVD